MSISGVNGIGATAYAYMNSSMKTTGEGNFASEVQKAEERQSTTSTTSAWAGDMVISQPPNYSGFTYDSLYEDYREQLITAEELCQYQREYESRVNEIEAQITELLHRRSLYEKEFHIDEGWEETVNKYMAKRKLTKELVDAFVSEIVFYDGNIEVKLLYDDFLKELLKVAEEREVSSNG